MRELGFDGVSEDQTFLLVRDASTDEQFRVPLTGEAAVLVTGATAPSPLVSSSATGSEPAMDTSITLSPRDIQSRIRRGESARQVADSCGMPFDRVDGFAGPVIAEREYMHQQARKTSLRRKHVTGAGMLLGALVDAAIIDSGGVPENAEWDAWRREDGRWTVLVTPAGSEHTATFIYDSRGRYVVPTDEFAHDLVGDVSLPDTPDMAIADAVRSPTPPVQTAAEISAQDAGLTPTPLSDTHARQTELEFSDLSDIPDDLPPDVAAAEALLDAAAGVSGVSSLKAARDRRTQEALAKQESEAAADSEIQHDVDQLDEELQTDVAVPDTAGPRKKRGERRRVPSWDEIMFGGKDD
ncbi:MAG: septation protein SepH [Aeromicrobium sp.]|uniref:septation protein SepH n=1 Tax=Aeromicrobium sp. TaxID=1871063 RepID=UPI003C495261